VPKVLLVSNYNNYGEDVLVKESTPWEEVTEDELKLLQKHSYSNNFAVIVPLPVSEALTTIGSYLRKLKLTEEKLEKEEKLRKAKREETKEKKKQKEIEKAKQLLAKEGILKNDQETSN